MSAPRRSAPRGAVASRTRAGYAAGDLGISIAYFAFGFFFLFYLTDIVGLPPALAGTVVLAGKVWDGVNDPLIGALSDRTRSARGRKRVYLLYGAAPFGVSFAALWWIPSTAPAGVAAGLGLILVLVFATTYSLVGVPYQALVPVMTSDYDERTKLIGYKAVFSAVGAILGGAIALVVSGRTEVESALRIMAVLFAIAITALVLLAARAVRHLARADTHPIAPVPLSHYLRLALEPNVRTLMGYKTLGAIATGMLTAALPYFALHVVEDARASSFSLAIYTLCSAGLVALWVRLARRFDKRRLILLSSSTAGALLVGIAVVSSPGSTYVFLVGSALLGAAMAAYLVLPPSLVPDLVDWYEHTSGERHESVFFGLWMTFHQLGLGAAALIMGLVLQLSGYTEDADTQSDSALLGVRLVFGVVPAIFLIAAAVMLQRYRITRARLATAHALLAAAHPERSA